MNMYVCRGLANNRRSSRTSSIPFLDPCLVEGRSRDDNWQTIEQQSNAGKKNIHQFSATNFKHTIKYLMSKYFSSIDFLACYYHQLINLIK